MFRKLLGGLTCVFMLVCCDAVWGQGIATLNGQWHVRKAVMNGQVVPEDVLASMMLNVNSSGEFTAESGGLSSNGKFAIGAAPDQLSVDIAGGADSGRKLKAKWRMETGDLTIAYSQGDFPANFDSTSGSNLLVVFYAAGPRPASAITSTKNSRPTAGVAGPAANNKKSGGGNSMSVTQ